ncbi:MAG: zinc ribbon domain-containing protein [Oscillospiraceae bacterium]|nr:zinc ribbon domain-containing protein [Oscillospiraceae bacterium]
MAKFCPDCGKPLAREDAAFCTSCGARITDAPAPAAPAAPAALDAPATPETPAAPIPPVPPQPMGDPKKGRGKKKPVVPIIIAAAVVVLLGAFVFCFIKGFFGLDTLRDKIFPGKNDNIVITTTGKNDKKSDKDDEDEDDGDEDEDDKPAKSDKSDKEEKPSAFKPSLSKPETGSAPAVDPTPSPKPETGAADSGVSTRPSVAPKPEPTPEPEPENTFSIGTVSNNYYENKFFGLAAQFGSEWTLDDRAAMDVATQTANGYWSTDYNAILESRGLVNELGGSADGGLKYVSANIEKLPAELAYLDEDGYMDLSMEAEDYAEVYKEMGIELVSSEKGTITVAGKTHTCMIMNTSVSGIPMYQKTIAIKVGDYILAISITTAYTDDVDEIFGYFFAI